MSYCINTNKLKAKAAENGTTLEGLAIELGIDRTTFYRRLRTNSLRVGDIHKLMDILSLSDADVIAIFLAHTVA